MVSVGVSAVSGTARFVSQDCTNTKVLLSCGLASLVTCKLASWLVASGCDGLVDMFGMDLEDLVDVKRRILNVIVVCVEEGAVCVCMVEGGREKGR